MTASPALPHDARSLLHRFLAMTGICLGQALIVMEANVVNIAVPTIRTELHAGAVAGLWAVDAYTLVFAALLLSAGRIGDRIGARRAILIGLAIFAAASLACAFAPSAGILIAARAVQGLGAALLAPAPLTLITRMYTDPVARAKAVAVWVSVGGIGFTIGPLLSGLLIGAFGWRSIFLINVPLVILTAGLLLGYVRETVRTRAGFDFVGQTLAGVGLAALIWGLVESAHDGWDSPSVLIALLGGIAVFAAFVAVQFRAARRGRPALLPPAILRSRPVLAGLIGGATYNFTLYGMLIVFTFDFQHLRHYGPETTGLAFLPLTAVAAVAAALVGGRFVNRFGPRAGVIAGMLVCALGLAVLAMGATSVPYLVLAIGFAIFGFGQSIVAPAQALAVMSFLPDENRNMGSSSLNAARQTGGVIGVALLGALVANNLTNGTPIALSVGVAACLAAAFGAVRLLPGRTNS